VHSESDASRFLFPFAPALFLFLSEIFPVSALAIFRHGMWMNRKFFVFTLKDAAIHFIYRLATPVTDRVLFSLVYGAKFT